MAKTSFSNSELINIRNILFDNKMFPCDAIDIGYDGYNSSSILNYYIIEFVKGNRSLRVGFVTKTTAKLSKLKEQLIKYFVWEK